MTRMLAGGIGLACAVMFLRAFILVFVLNRNAALILVWPLLCASASALVIGTLLLRSDTKKNAAAAELDLGPPADIQTALKFAAALIVIELAVHYGRTWMGAAGSVAAAALAGLVDVDAATISVARLGESAASGEVVGAVLAAVAVNTVVPFVGASLIWAPAALYLLLSDQTMAALGLTAWGLIVVGLVDNFLRPMIVGGHARLPITLLFLGVLGGLQIYGLVGALISPLLIACVFAFARIYRERYGT